MGLRAKFFHITTPYKLTFFKYINEYLNKKDFSETLISCYTEMEVIADETNVKKTEIIKWFEKADKKYLMDKEDYEKYTSLPEKLTIYRGVRNPEYKYEMSWTLSKSKAEWFANRFDSDNPIVLKVLIDKKDILCYTNDRGEDEVIINPKKIDKEKVVEYEL